MGQPTDQPNRDSLWEGSRSGSHAGRGFRYQDAVATEFALHGATGNLAVRQVVPEGLDDVSIELASGWVHMQVKSRRGHRGVFAAADVRDVWPALAQRLVADPGSRAALVLERPLEAAETGLSQTLDAVASKGLRADIAAALRDSAISPEDFLRRTHVVVTEASPETAVALLAELTDAPPLTRRAYRDVLRGHIGQLADANGEPGSGPDRPAAVTPSGLARLLDEAALSFDPSALDEAVRTGICEVADFATPRVDDGFYTGVDVTVGHVVAGLPAERPEECAALRQTMLDRGLAISAGPSGSGKSALLWMTAFATRHEIRWYRIKRLTDHDVAPLAQLVKGLDPDTAGPVGLVVDDLGRADRLGFDALADELREHDGAYLLAACREEDLVLVRNAPPAARVRSTMDEALAQRLWRELRDSNATEWPEWHEPFRRSEGLLLEYGHLLTSGSRLADSVGEQIARRVRERRDAELDVLAPPALASAVGAKLAVDRLADAIDRPAGEVRAALARLIDEHLVTEADGMLEGLHELRSLAVTRALHAFPPPTLEDTAATVIGLLDADGLRTAVTRMLLSGLVPEAVVIDATVKRIDQDLDPDVLAAALHALRVAALRAETEQWREILEEEGVDLKHVGLVTHYVTYGFGGLEDLFGLDLRRGVERILALERSDPRAELARRLGPTLAGTVAAATDLEQASEVIAALAEAEFEVTLDAGRLAGLAADAPLPELRTFLEAVNTLSGDLAVDVVTRLGGAASLLQRLEHERPWVRNVALDHDDTGAPIARAEYVHVGQDDPHADVVALAEFLAAFAPMTEVAMARAVDVRGQAAGYSGHPIADKAIPRENNPGRVVVAWNRARGRAAYAATAAESETEYQLAARDLVRKAVAVARRAGTTYAQGKRPSQRLLDDRTALSTAVKAIRRPPQRLDVVGPLQEGDLTLTDAASSAAGMIADNLVPRMFDPEDRGSAHVVPQIAAELTECADAGYWHMLATPPLEQVAALQHVIRDLHAVVAESEAGPSPGFLGMQTAAKDGLATAAALARRLAEKRWQERARAVEASVAGVQVARLPGDESGPWWPPDVSILLADVDSLLSWDPEPIAAAARSALDEGPPFLVVPVRGGRVVASQAIRVFGESIVPTTDLKDEVELPLPLLAESLTTSLHVAIDGLVTVSTVVATLPSGRVHADEQAVIDDACRRTNDAINAVSQIASDTGNRVPEEIGTALRELVARVEDEAACADQGTPVDRSFAHSFLDGVDGKPDDLMNTCVGCQLLALEFDVEPEQSERLLEAHEDSPGEPDTDSR